MIDFSLSPELAALQARTETFVRDVVIPYEGDPREPARVLAPEWSGVTCVSERICLDDVTREAEAVALYDEAYEFVTSRVGAIERKPRAILCASQSCFRSFGFDTAGAHTVGVSRIVVGPHGWKDYYMRHEMIHHLQAERLGVVRQWLLPKWFTEGMAYSLSGDPRPPLTEPRMSCGRVPHSIPGTPHRSASTSTRDGRQTDMARVHIPQRSLGAVALLVPDYQEAIDYFVDTLGFTLVEDTRLSEDKRWVLVSPGSGSALLLARADGERQRAAIGNQSGGRVFLFLTTDDFWRDYRTYESRGVEFQEKPRREEYGMVVVFTDRYGNRWDLIERSSS